MAFLYSLDLLPYSIAQFLFQRFWWMDDFVSSGGFDEYLIRPVRPFLLFISRNTAFGYWGHITIAFLALLFTMGQVNAVWSFGNVISLFLMIIGAVMIQSAITIMSSCLSFVFVKANQLASMIRFDFRDYIMYPVSIYPKAIRGFFTAIVPMAFINYFPAVYLLGKNNSFIFYEYIPLMVILIGIILTVLTFIAWSKGLRQYKSSGS